MHRFAYLQPQSPAAAAAVLAQHPHALLKAGGVDLLDLLKERIVAPTLLVDISQIAELRTVSIDPDSGALRLGTLATFAQIARHADVREHWPALAHVAAGAATPQIRHMATVGGNLCQRPRCWYFRQEEYRCRKRGGTRCFAHEGDNRYHAIFANQTCASVHPSAAAVPLLAYGATLQVVDKDGTERTVPVAEFFVTPERDVGREHVLRRDEVLTTITVPRLPAGAGSAYLNLKHKQSFDWPLVEVAVVLHMERGKVRDARIALGSVAPIPFRAAGAEQVLVGHAVGEDLAARAGQAATAGAVPLSHNGYKIPLLAELVRRAVLKAAGQLPPTDEVTVL
ncbi:MAG: FAD binding domain-containing protein [Thermodesulfobacteriota bacterium]|jgi:xanthine dehydrogenase YagS FAD-binding subunit